ncbi:BamA/TamA family outer membrane protein [Pedobacter sp. N36a]|uniref:BamA/TamA family outer membrane protein n=1 Tax=Pedobacter sp. N36a TaxID=2767996 RepID=UPI00165736A8|nr:BamA/TamA family outer membrane protein [Pedobacter sp. N36a]MBC8984918.1 BamA/TamA family outer membrane protein [Pedobacter sp. N36a]
MIHLKPYFNIFLMLLLFPFCVHAQNAGNVLPENNQVLDTAKQRDLIDVAKSIFNIKPGKIKEEKGKHVYFSILPVGATVPGGSGRALITSTTAAVYLGPKATTNLSTATFTPYWNFGSRFGLPIRNNIWLPDNTWLIQGDTRFLVYPQYTWGLGTKRAEEEKVLLDYKYIRFYQNALKRIRPYFYAGLGYNLDYRFNIKPENADIDLANYTGYKYGTGSNSVSSGLSLNLVYDTRSNAINPMPGIYANLVYRINPTYLGSNNTWRSLYLDVRKYISMNKENQNQQNTLAFWSYFWTALDAKTPYLDLPSTGWDPYNRSARGIDQNRYRGRSLLYLESEYRRDITSNGLVGFVVFANVNSVGVSGGQHLFSSWKPAAGTGLRLKFNKGSNTNIGVDYGMSKGYKNISFNLGEAF